MTNPQCYLKQKKGKYIGRGPECPTGLSDKRAVIKNDWGQKLESFLDTLFISTLVFTPGNNSNYSNISLPHRL